MSEELRKQKIDNICDYFNKGSGSDKIALMHAISTHFPPSRKLSGSVRSVLNQFSLEDLNSISDDCDFNR